VAIAASIGIAALSYYMLEVPLLRLKKRFEFRAAVPVVAVREVADVVVPLVPVGAGVRVPAQREPLSARQLAVRAARSRGAVVRRPAGHPDLLSAARGR
jgi:peptidoglycan/LPS O-acetylase OafA/YrhL